MDVLKPIGVVADVMKGLAAGESLQLWTKPGLDFINAYVPGTVGGQGRAFQLMKADHPTITSTLQSGRRTWLEVTAVKDGAYHLSAKCDSEQDVLDRFKAARAHREQLLDAPPKTLKPIAITVESRMPTRLQEGFVLPFIDEPKENYLRQSTLSVEFVVPEILRVATIRKPSSAVEKILQAHFNGYRVRLEITAEPEKATSGDLYSYWEVLLAPGTVTFHPR